MQSKKRFTETNIWDSPTFMNLTPQQKLCWFFINDRCDNIGVWTPNPKLIAFNLDIKGNPQKFLDDFLKAINENIELVFVMNNGEWLITNFVKFQYCQKKPLHPNNPAHKSYLQLIREQNLLSWFSENYPETLPESALNEEKKTSRRPLSDSLETHKDKEKDRDRDRDTDKAQELEPFKEFAP